MTGYTGFASAMWALASHLLADRGSDGTSEGGALPLRRRFAGGGSTKRVAQQRSPPKHWPSQ